MAIRYRRSPSSPRRRVRFGRSPARRSPARSPGRRRLSKYNLFVKSHAGKGMNFKQIASLWHRQK